MKYQRDSDWVRASDRILEGTEFDFLLGPLILKNIFKKFSIN